MTDILEQQVREARAEVARLMVERDALRRLISQAPEAKAAFERIVAERDALRAERDEARRLYTVENLTRVGLERANAELRAERDVGPCDGHAIAECASCGDGGECWSNGIVWTCLKCVDCPKCAELGALRSAAAEAQSILEAQTRECDQIRIERCVYSLRAALSQPGPAGSTQEPKAKASVPVESDGSTPSLVPLALRASHAELVGALKKCVDVLPGLEVRSWPPGFRMKREAVLAARAALANAEKVGGK